MSFIHEALKRSERARRLLGASRLEPADAALAPPRRSRWLPWIVLLLVVNLGLLAWFGWRASMPPAETPAHLGGEVRSLEREAGSAAAGSAPRAPSAADVGTTPVHAMPADAAEAAALHIDAHAWSEDPAQRFVIVNLKRRVVGDQLESGAKLVEITVDGIVVERDGRRTTIPKQ